MNDDDGLPSRSPSPSPAPSPSRGVGRSRPIEIAPSVLPAGCERLDVDIEVDIEVDGGIGPVTVQAAATAGANVFVAGSALFGHPDGLERAVAELRALAEATSS